MDVETAIAHIETFIDEGDEEGAVSVHNAINALDEIRREIFSNRRTIAAIHGEKIEISDALGKLSFEYQSTDKSNRKLNDLLVLIGQKAKKKFLEDGDVFAKEIFDIVVNGFWGGLSD